jgi:AcrR family transcriptional regulator
MADEPARGTVSGRDRVHRQARARRSPRRLPGGESQREALLGAVVEVAAREGFPTTTLAQVIAQARVSRRTFHEHFADKEDCFLAALGDAWARLLAEMRAAISLQPERSLQLTIRTLVSFAGSEPAAAHVLLIESMAGGSRALDARDRAIDQIAQAIEASYESLDPATTLPDVSARMLIGGVCRLLASRLRHSQQATPGLLEDLLAWTATYERPLAAHRWRGLRPTPLPAPSPPSPNTALHSPRALGQGDQATSRVDLAASNRSRILAAVASSAEQHGYAATTITDIASRAGVSPRTFYRSFANKREAFAALHEDHFRTLMGVTAGAFFAQDAWPARIWEAGRAFTRYLEQSPTLARTSFIESYAGDPLTLQRVEELVAAFTLFLQEGYQYSRLPATPSPLALEAIATTIFELNYRYTRAERVCELPALIPQTAFISLGPFLGPTHTNAFIDEQLSFARRHPPD